MSYHPSVSALSLYQQRRKWYGHSSNSTNDQKNCGNHHHYPRVAADDDSLQPQASSVLLPPHLELLLTNNYKNQANSSKSSSLSFSSSSSRSLDNHNGGGITEIAGEAGTGKTQICLSACVSCVFMTHEDDRYDSTIISNQNNSNNSYSTTTMMSDNLTQPNLSTIESMNQRTNVERSRPIINPYKKKQKVMNFSNSSSLPNNNTNKKTSIQNPYSRPSQTNHTSPNASNINTNYQPQQSLLNNNHDIQNQSLKNHESFQKKYFKSIFVSMGESVTEQQIAQRLDQMVEERIRLTNPCLHESQSSLLKHLRQMTLNRIFTRFLHNEDDLFRFLSIDLPEMLQKQKEQSSTSSSKSINDNGRFGLIVFDSIAGIFRIPESSSNNSENNKNYYSKRSESFFQIATQLKKLSYEFGIHVLVVNQVTSTIADCTNNYTTTVNLIDNGDSSRNRINRFNVKPSLGLSWSNCINSRYLVTRKERSVSLSDKSSSTGQQQNSSMKISKTRFHRELHLLQSPCYSSSSKDSSLSFLIDKIGCRVQE